MAALAEIIAAGQLPRYQLWIVAALALLVAGSAVAGNQAAWPEVAIPTGIATYGMGDQVTANGLPIRMRGFASAATPERLAASFRQSLGQPLVEDRVAGKLVLGRAQGAYYVTVQLAPAGNGTRGVVAVTRLPVSNDEREAARSADGTLLARLPAGSSLVSRIASVDGRNSSDQLVLTNTHSNEVNARYIKDLLESQGFRLQRTAAGAPGARPVPAGRDGKTLFFSSAGGEAMAVIARDDQGRSAIVLNTVRYAGVAK
jgi:hypothetical protein